MKRITNFLMLLMLAMCSIGASAQTTVSLNGTSTTGGTFYKGGKYSQGAGDAQTGSTWCCSWVNTGSTPQITLEVRDGTWGNMNSYNANGFAMYRGNSGLVNGNTLYYRLAIANGYRINGIEMQFYNANASYPVTLSCNGVSATATSTSASAAATLTVTDLKAQYVDIALTVGANQGCFVPVFNVTYEAADIEYNYSYTMYDASHNELGTGSNSLMGYAEGYTFTAPSVNGYAFLSAVDGTTFQPLDLSGTITATSIVLLYSPILSDLASADATKAYTLTTPRAFIHAESADATEFSRTMVSNGTADMTNPLHQWTFVTLGGKTYLYNVGAKKFASYTTNKSHHLVTSAPAYVTGDASTYKTGYPIVLKFTNDANTDQPTATLNMSAGGVMIDSWTTHDEGNVQQILQVPSVTVVPEAYVANFTCTGGGLTSVYVDGTEVALGTDVVLTSGATVSSSAAVNAIESYNGFATLAEALADANFAGTVDVALPATLTTVTLNVTRDNRVVKTVTIENVPENTEINVVSALGGTPNYVSNISPTTVTSSDVDQTVTVTYDSSLPFELSADPTDATVSTPYFFILRSKYAYGNNVTSSSSYDLTNDEYYWTFGGNEFDGITVYNRTHGYMRVGTTDNSVATFDTTPFAFAISPNNNQTDGFNLYVPGTNSYINDRGNKISTWLHSAAASDAGSCLKVFTINDLVLNLIASDIDPYFEYAGCVNALQVTDASNLAEEYSALKAAPNYNDYLTFKAKVEGYQMVEATEGYYLILSGLDAFRTKQGVDKAMLYNTSSKNVAWGNVDVSAAQIMKLKAVEGTTTFRLYVPLAGTYLQTKAGVTTEDEASGIAFEVVAKKPSKVALVYNANGGTDAALHAAGHNSGAGASGSLTGWTTDGDASMWHLIPVDIDEITLISPEGVADGEEVMQGFANGYDAQLPLNVGVFTITEDLGAGARLDTIATSQIAADQGYIISGVKGATVPLLPVNGTVDVPAGNLLVAGDGSSVVSGGYILAYKKGEAEAKFWSINGLTVPANRSYLPAGTPTRGLENIFGGIGEDVTGINGITTGAENGTVYDLQGRRVNNATKGVYIINGKKVIK